MFTVITREIPQVALSLMVLGPIVGKLIVLAPYWLLAVVLGWL